MAPQQGDETSLPYPTATSRRTIIKSIAGSALGGMVAIDGSSLSVGAKSNTLLLPNAALVPLEKWRWCIKCAGLFYSGYKHSGWCPAGGGHNGITSADYTLLYAESGTTIPDGLQDNWRYCYKCSGLFFGREG